jgi:hypothetical protein
MGPNATPFLSKGLRCGLAIFFSLTVSLFQNG